MDLRSALGFPRALFLLRAEFEQNRVVIGLRSDAVVLRWQHFPRSRPFCLFLLTENWVILLKNEFFVGGGVVQHLGFGKADSIRTMRTVYLAYETAWWYWRNAKNAAATLAVAKRCGGLSRCVSSQEMLSEVLQGSVFRDQPWVAMVSRRTFSNTKRVCFRYCSTELPEGSFVRLSAGVCIASPELSFLQFAADNSLVSAIEYGFMLCGSFVLDASSKYGVVPRAPLTSVKKLRTFLEKCKGLRLRGASLALKALGYVLEGSASPRESRISILLELPLRMGGYALPTFLVNYELPVKQGLCGLVGRKKLRVDFFGKERRVAAEYDSDVAHLESADLCDDATKRIALHQMGFVTFGFTRLQVDNLRLMNESVAALRRELGVRAPERLPRNYGDKQLELRRQLGFENPDCWELALEADI